MMIYRYTDAALMFSAFMILLANILITPQTLWGIKSVRSLPVKLTVIVCYTALSVATVAEVCAARYGNAYGVLIAVQYAATAAAPAIFYGTKCPRVIYSALFIIFAESAFSASVGLLRSIIGIGGDMRTVSYSLSLLFECLWLIMLYLCRRNIIFRNFRQSAVFVPTSVYVLILADLFLTGGLVTCLSFNTDKVLMKLEYSQGLAALLSVVILLTLIFLVFRSLSHRYYESIAELLKKQMEKQVEYYERLDEKNNEIRAFRHDYNNHMLCLKAMLEWGSFEEAAEYVAGLSDKGLTKQEFNTGNHIADAVLSEKKKLCESIGIAFGHSGLFPPAAVEPTDICIMLSNALDNAVEACESLPPERERFVKLSSDYKNGYLYILISNSCGEVAMEGQHIHTSKKDDSMHGFGIPNIRRIAAKYDGTVGLSCEDGVFTMELALNLTAVSAK